MATPVIKTRFENENADAAEQQLQRVRQLMVDAARAANDLHRAYAQAAGGDRAATTAAAAANKSAVAMKSAADSAAVFERALIRQDRALATAERQMAAFTAAVMRSSVGQQEQARLIQAAQASYASFSQTIQRVGTNQLAAATATNQWRGSLQRLSIELGNLKLAEQAASMQRFHQMAASGGRALGGYGLVLQQVGFQGADMAVQLQAGTNAIQVLTQQGSQLLGFFGPVGAIIGAVGAVVGATATALLRMETEASVAQEATKELSDALLDSEKAAIRSTLAEVQLAEAVKQTQTSTAELTGMSYERITALKQQQTAALETAKAEVEAARARVVAAQADAEVQRIMAEAAGGNAGAIETPDLRDATARLERMQATVAALQASLGDISATIPDIVSREILGPLEDQVAFQEKLSVALKQGAAAVREVRIEEAIRIEQAKLGKDATAEQRAEVARLTRSREELTAANDAAMKAEADAAAEARRASQEAKRLSDQRTETIADIQGEIRYLRDLREAHGQDQEAIDAVKDAREADLIIQKLKIGQDDIEAGLIRELVQRRNEEKRAIDDIVEAQRKAEKAAEDLARKQAKAAEDASRAYEKVIDDIARNSQEKLGDAIFDHLKGETVDFAQFLKDTLLRAIADIAAAALTQQIVIPIATQVVGAVPGLFGLSGQAAGVARGQAGGGLFGSGNPLSSLTNLIPTDGLYNSFAMSGLGQSLGLSYGAGTLATAPGMFFAGGAVPGAIAASPALTLAATGPAGGFGTLAGISTASTGGAVGAATAGGSLAASGGLTGLGAGLGAALPYIGAAIAIASIFGPMLFGGNPSVGPVGIADFSPGLGRRGAFDVPGIDPFTSDNGGNAEGLRPIAEAIADLIADSADRFSATIEQSLRFRVANYQSPESGSGRQQGFEVNAFIRGEAEKRVAEGLSQEQAMFESLKFAVQEAFTFDSATLTEVAANTAATTTEELLADLEFGRNFDMLSGALADLGGVVDANTLAAAQLQVAILNQAEEFAKGAAEPIVENLRKAIELFPGMITETITRAVTDASSAAADLAATTDALRPGESRFVDQFGNEFAGNLPHGLDADRDAEGRVILPGTIEGLGPDGQPVFPPGTIEGQETYIRALEETATVTEEITRQSEQYAANLERVGLAVDMAKVGMDLLVDQITGDYEPAVRGPFQQALEQGQANLDALRTHFEDVNTQIAAANEAFPGLNKSLIDVTQTIADAQAALLANLQDDFRRSVEDALDPQAASRRAFVDASKVSLTDAVSIGLGGDEPLMRDLFRAFSDGAVAAGLGIQGTVAALEELRVAAGEAGVTVTQLVDGALNDLRDSFGSSIQAQTNAARGLGVINTIQGLVDTRDVNLSDAAALGIEFPQDGPNPVLDLFDAQLRQSLSGASLADLNEILKSGQIVDAGAQAIIQTILAEKALADVRTAEVTNMQALFDEHQRFADAANDNARKLREAASGLLVNRDLSPLSPLDRLNEARRQFNEAFALANDADPTDAESQYAIQQLPALSETLLQASRDYYASSSGYLADFNRVQDALNSTALRQESIEQQQLDAMRDIEKAIQDLGGSLTNQTPAQIAAAGGFDFGRQVSKNQGIYNDLIRLGLPTPEAFGQGQLNALRASNPAVDAYLRAKGYADGGLVTGGLPGVDSVPAWVMPGERIFSVPHSRMLENLAANQSGGSAMVSELRALRSEVERLRTAVGESGRQVAATTAAGSLRVAGAVQEGNAATKRMASAAERNSARPVAA